MEKVPSLEELKAAYALVRENGKIFTYVTPLVSDSSLQKVEAGFKFLNREDGIEVVVNDLGVFNMLERYPNLSPHLGRQLIYIPARCPWPQTTSRKKSFFNTLKRKSTLNQVLFSQTSLNYLPTIQFLQNHGVKRVDVDWIPECIKHYDFLVTEGLRLSVYAHFILVALTRRCHTARFLGDKEETHCSRACDTRAFLLKQNNIQCELYLSGNTIFSRANPTKREVKWFEERESEFIIETGPIVKALKNNSINALISTFES